MYKMRVKEVSPAGLYRLDGGIGSFKPRNHPLVLKDAVTWSYRSDITDLKVGDLLRCDGLPYMSRPKTIYRTVEDAVLSKHVYYRLYKEYIPFKLKSGYWVLRKVS